MPESSRPQATNEEIEQMLQDMTDHEAAGIIPRLEMRHVHALPPFRIMPFEDFLQLPLTEVSRLFREYATRTRHQKETDTPDAPPPLHEHHALFFKTLLALCREYQVTIGGCGCCGSPWVQFSLVPADFDDMHASPEKLTLGELPRDDSGKINPKWVLT